MKMKPQKIKSKPSVSHGLSFFELRQAAQGSKRPWLTGHETAAIVHARNAATPSDTKDVVEFDELIVEDFASGKSSAKRVFGCQIVSFFDIFCSACPSYDLCFFLF